MRRPSGCLPLLLAQACAQGLTVDHLAERVAARRGIILDCATARSAVYRLANRGLLRRSNPEVHSPYPAEYVLTAEGEDELERLWRAA